MSEVGEASMRVQSEKAPSGEEATPISVQEIPEWGTE